MPAEAIAPAPPSPTPTPTPAPAPAPVPAPAPALTSTISDPFAELSAILPSKAEVEGGDKGKPAPKPDDKKPDPGTPPPKPGEKPLAVKKDPLVETRARIEQQNQEITGLRRELEQLKTNAGGDTKSLASLVEQKDREIAQLRGELGARDYTKHPDYVAKFENPFNDAAEYSKNILESLTVVNKDGTERLADWKKDFAPIYSLPRPAARERAKELFGDDANSVMQQYDDLHRLDSAKQKAIGEWQSGADERDKTQRGQELANRQKVSQGFNHVTTKLTETDPLFQIKPDDVEANDIWNKSKAVVDGAYYGRDKKTLAELVVLDAAIRLRAINEPVLRSRIQKLEAELADYKERVNGKEASRGGGVRKVGDPAKVEEADWQKDLSTTLKTAG